MLRNDTSVKSYSTYLISLTILILYYFYRNRTENEIVSGAIEAVKRYSAGVKCPTITPNEKMIKGRKCKLRQNDEHYIFFNFSRL